MSLLLQCLDQKDPKIKKGAGGDRRSAKFRQRNKSQHDLIFNKIFKKKSDFSTNTQHYTNVDHPLSEKNMIASQSYLKLILEHPSMPKSTHLPNYCTVIEEKKL